jgi:multiple sugar transport system substrate-binding protein
VKFLAVTLLISLLLASAVTYFSFSGSSKERPVLYWVTTAEPIRAGQLELFQEWLKKNDYPEMEIRIDVRAKKNAEVKNTVQGVSGVAADLIDCFAGEVLLYQAVGMLEDVTDVAKEMGFEGSQTYSSERASMHIDGRQYGFPRNAGPGFLWVNSEAFERVGLPVPPHEWSFDEFERIGRAYVEAHNIPGRRQEFYFVRALGGGVRAILARSMGTDIFNETMTKSNYGTDVFREVFELNYRWIYDSRIVPTIKEAEALSSNSSALSQVEMYLFSQGNFGVMSGGRWGLMHFREVGPHQLSISEYPHGGFRNGYSGGGIVGVYAKSKRKELAYYFLKFLASEEFNHQIIENGDGLPPVTQYTETEEYLHPAKYPNEWDLHDRIRRIEVESGIAYSFSPFVLRAEDTRLEKNAFDKFIVNRSSAEEALAMASKLVNESMLRRAYQSEKSQLHYEKLLKDQETIERLRNEGKLVPLELITNPFYRRYYVEKGWSLPESSSSVEAEKL